MYSAFFIVIPLLSEVTDRTPFCFFFNDTATTEIYTLSLHDALPISWQPTNNPTPTRGPLPGPEFEAAKQAIAARLASAIHYAYRQGGASPEGACAPPDSGEDSCTGGDVAGATFTDAWQVFESWG